MRAFILRAIAYLIVFAFGMAVISLIVLKALGNYFPRSILDGLMMGAIVVVAGTIGGKLANEFKALRSRAKEPGNN